MKKTIITKQSGIPTDMQIREYLGVLGQSVNQTFLLGFVSGWTARNNGFKPNSGAPSSTVSQQHHEGSIEDNAAPTIKSIKIGK
ncbi:MAG: hypothetical protein WC365_06355 [Candidatus Babeliales bacterium]|jgi:hypothetical protein